MDPLLIGITTDYAPAELGRDPRFFLKSSYVSYFQDGGASVVLLPFPFSPHQQDWRFLDGIVLSGSGPDIPPMFYDEEKTFLPGHWMPEERVAFEFSLISLSEREGIPLFGICGGFQTMNVYRGGSLVQDLPSMCSGGLVHQDSNHDVALGEGWKELYEPDRAAMSGRALVNSFHHQGVKRLGERLKVEAISGDGLVEGFRDPDHPFFVGVQWHPERMPSGDSFSQGLRNAFLDASRTFRSRRR